MIVICEECGKKYRVDPDKIKGESVTFPCRSCGHEITALKTAADRNGPQKPADTEPVAPPPPAAAGGSPGGAGRAVRTRTQRKGPGLRIKMLALFVFVPLLIITAVGLLYVRQMADLAYGLTGESTEIVSNMAEDLITQNARTVAREVQLFLEAHPDLKRENFNTHPVFAKIATQKVGQTGYACIYSVPDETGLSSLWAHPNPKVIGIDVPEAMKKPLGKEYHRWWNIYKGAYNGKESKGYYLWEDADGRLREKFMVCTPVEGTPFIVASTTYLDEFTRPAKLLETRSHGVMLQTRNIVIAIFGATIILVALIASIYGTRLTKKINSLTDVADRISIGELDAEIEIQSKDELGDLGNAISRMQDSIRISIQRLRRKR